MSKGKLGKGSEIFKQPVSFEEVKPLLEAERGEKTIFMIKPSQREALEEFVWRAKRHHREVNNSMVVRCLLSVFSEMKVNLEGIESEEMLKDRIVEAWNTVRVP